MSPAVAKVAVEASLIEPHHELNRLQSQLSDQFLSEIGWDAETLVLSLPADHPLLGRPVCRAPGCEFTARGVSRICQGCRSRLARHGLGLDDIDKMPPRDRDQPGPCVVTGCERSWGSSQHRLCEAHRHQQRVLGVSIEDFLAHPSVIALPDTGPCLVAACTRRRKATRGSYCSAHEQRWHAKRRNAHDTDTDERVWWLTATASKEPGKVSLRGLPPLVVAQVLYGVRERIKSGRKLDDFQLTALCSELRRQRVASIADADTTGLNVAYRGLMNSFAGYLRRGTLNPETERTKDVWDLAAFGYRGRLRFVGISQPWLREAAKRWALDDLPRRRGKRVGHLVSHHVGCLERLSESLRMRSDRGEVPSMLGRADIDNFLNRLTYLESTGALTRDARIRACQQTKTMLSRIRALGLTRQREPAAGLSQEFVLQTSDMPRRPDREPGRDLPPEILRQICEHLPQLEALGGPEMRAAVEILIDTGRRPDEVCSLAWDCLDRDADDKPVLIYDNDKADRPGRRLPIPEATAEVITRQKQRVRARYPDTPVGELALLPARTIQQGGRRPLSASRLCHRHREWIDAIGELRTADGNPFDTTRLVAYCYRHTYAQRHADSGVPPDVLRELMNHRDLKATQRYYRVEEKRRRDAVDRVSALQFDRHGNRIWRDVKALLDSEYVRRAVGEVAVPYGVCSEPSNVKANGQSCPYRFRCLGCEHFRTDVSYLPDLQAHLDDLLRIRERLQAATDIDDWARADAMPSDTEIALTRGLIQRIKGDLDQLGDDERADIDQAVAAVRPHRVTLLGMPRIAPSPPQQQRLQEGSA